MEYNLTLKLRGNSLKLLRKSLALTSQIKGSQSFPLEGNLKGPLVSSRKRNSIRQSLLLSHKMV
jgi:hypothetical protein